MFEANKRLGKHADLTRELFKLEILGEPSGVPGEPFESEDDWETISASFERHKQNQKLMQNRTYRHLTNMRLVSKAFGAEFFSVYLNHTRPVFTLDASSPPENDPLRIPRDMLPTVKTCTPN